MSEQELKGRELFAQVSDELFNNVVNPEDVDAEEPSAEAEVEEVVEEAPEEEAEGEEVLDSEEDTDDDLLEDDDEGEVEDTEEDPDDNHEITFTADGEEVTMTRQELIELGQKHYGKDKAQTAREQANAERAKQLDELQNTITHLQYQGKFAPRFHQIESQEAIITAAKEALAAGKEYRGSKGNELAQEITTSEVIVDKARKDLEKEYEESFSNIDAPGRKALEERLPDIAEKYNDYAKVWGDIGTEFGFTPVELAHNTDFRWWNMTQEVAELRQYKADTEARIERNRKKRGTGSVAKKSSPSKSPPSSKKKGTNETDDFEKLNERAIAGDREARGQLMRGFLES